MTNVIWSVGIVIATYTPPTPPGPPPTPGPDQFRLLEDWSYRLLENGDFRLLE